MNANEKFGLLIAGKKPVQIGLFAMLLTTITAVITAVIWTDTTLPSFMLGLLLSSVMAIGAAYIGMKQGWSVLATQILALVASFIGFAVFVGFIPALITEAACNVSVPLYFAQRAWALHHYE